LTAPNQLPPNSGNGSGSSRNHHAHAMADAGDPSGPGSPRSGGRRN
jgi:hypothetical protein